MVIQRKGIEGVSVDELLSLLPDELIDNLAESLSVDKWVKKLKAGYLFKLVMFSLLSSERLSLRIMEENFEDPMFRLLAPALEADEVTWAGIRDRLMKVDSAFFRKLYTVVYKRAKELYGDERLAGYHIKKYDSTMIATFSHLLSGMKVGNTKKNKVQVKLTTEFTDGFLIQMEFHQEQKYLSEERALKQAVEQGAKHPVDATATDKDIHVFDRGLKSRKTFSEFDNENNGDNEEDSKILFVTRLDKNPRYELLRPHWQDDGSLDTDELEFIQDSVVHLYKSGNKICETEFRLIQFYIKGESKKLSFLTNVWDLSADQIAGIYKSRWDIEVLFRFMKQEMNLTHFVCNDLNAIKVMLYCSMIASMLVLIYKKKNNIKSFKKAKIRFFKELSYSILLDILENPSELNRFKHKLKLFIQRE